MKGDAERVAMPMDDPAERRPRACVRWRCSVRTGLEIRRRLGEQHGELQREDVLAIQVLMHAGLVAGVVFKSSGPFPDYPRCVA